MSKENVEQVVEEQVIEETTVEETTEIDVDALVKSERSKAKYEVLKELGIKNVKEGKELVAKGLQYETTSTTLNEIQVEYESMKVENEQFKADKLYNDTSIKLLASGFNPERLEGIKPLINSELDVEGNVESIRGTFPELFIDSKRVSTTTPSKATTQDTKTEAQKYFERRLQQKLK